MKKFWLPYPMWDMLGIELWLNEMAAQGWALGDWPRFTFIGRVPFLPLDWVKESRYRPGPHQPVVRRAGPVPPGGQLPGYGLAVRDPDRQAVRRLPL